MDRGNETGHVIDVNLTTIIHQGVRPALRLVFPVFVTIYAFVALSGVCGNICMLCTLIRRQLCSDTTFMLLANVAIADLMKSSIALPLTLYRILIETWNLGKFCCYFVAVIQSWPLYASVLTFLAIAIDRHRRIARPMCKRLHAALAICVIWFISGCASIPLILYVRYIDKSDVPPSDLALLHSDMALLDLQYCMIYHEFQFEDYVRGLFTALYVIPLISIVVLNFKISSVLRKRVAANRMISQTRLLVGTFGNQFSAVSVTTNTNTNTSNSHAQSQSQSNGIAGINVHNEVSRSGSSMTNNCAPKCADGIKRNVRQHSITQQFVAQASPRNSDDLTMQQDALTLSRDLRAQKYISLMVFVFAACWCPLHILHAFYVLSNHDEENENENEVKIDISYLMFFWLGFLSACINPLIFTTWRLPQSTRNRLRGYFRFSLRADAPLIGTNNLLMNSGSNNCNQLPPQMSHF